MPSAANPETNQFRCNACGRYFNTHAELRVHEVECRAAKMATPEGGRELAIQDREPHQPNDAESKELRFQHGTRPSDAEPEANQVTQAEIEARAYELWQERGCPNGSADLDWQRAEDELLGGRKTIGATA